jgi:hypothetical protein
MGEYSGFEFVFCFVGLFRRGYDNLLFAEMDLVGS